MSLPSFDFLYIKAGDGKTGTTGDRLEVSWTTNFDLIKNLLSQLDTDVSKRIISNEIQQIKVENNVAYFTTDDGKTWVSLGPSFANISGNPDDCPALVAKFKNYATSSQMTNVENRVSSVESSVVLINNTLKILDSDVSDIKETLNNSSTGVLVRLAAVEVDLNKKITSQSVIEIKEVGEGQLQYTTNGTDWHPVAAAIGVEWGAIGGNIENQADLMNKFDVVNDAIAEIEKSINDHLVDYTNPHKVSASQIGLGNVDNTSDAEKPVSNPQKQAISEAVSAGTKALKVNAMTTSEYEALEAKDDSTVYIITDQEQ